MGGAVGPDGRVVAWEPTNFHDATAQVRWEALATRVGNAELLVSPADAISLPRDSFDFVLMHMIYHDFYWQSEEYKFPRVDPAAVLAEVFAATKPGGIVGVVDHAANPGGRSEEHTSELQSLMRISYAVFCLQQTQTILSA